jgi:hypothetical protein
VVWVYDGSPVIMALVVDGIPTRAEFAASEPAIASMASVLAMGRQVRLVS